MRCLVTGASGFLGSHLVRRLLKDGHSVVALLRPESDLSRIGDCLLSELCVVQGSLEDLSHLASAIPGQSIDVTFHMAWTGVAGEHRNSARQVTDNVIGTLNLWQAISEFNCKVFVGIGSQAEYGPQAGVLHEGLATAPETAYGCAKLALSHLLRPLCLSAKMRFVWARLLSAYGPADDERHMVPSLISSLLRNERPLLTAGEQVWDYIYVEDVISALCALMDSDAEGLFNLGSGAPCVLRDFITAVRDYINPALPLGFGEVPYRQDQVMHLEADISRLKNATGWTPRIDLEEGIRRTVDWYRTRAEYAK